MLQPLNVPLAQKIGIRTALVAQYLWDALEERYSAETDIVDGRQWLRIGQTSLTTILPYLTRHTARFELRRLKKLGIIQSRDLNDNRFDHTNWYCFTDYGSELMISMEEEGLEGY